MRIGFGYDSHVFTDAEKPLYLGGVLIEGAQGLKAHSDGDVVIHALIDALFGAAALGDIGGHFPDSDPQWKGADSTHLLATAVREVAAAGFRIGNCDITVICEKPRLSPHVLSIRERLAGLLAIPLTAVSVKGKTNEKMDDVGAGKGIEVHCVVLLNEIKPV